MAGNRPRLLARWEQPQQHDQRKRQIQAGAERFDKTILHQLQVRVLVATRIVSTVGVDVANMQRERRFNLVEAQMPMRATHPCCNQEQTEEAEKPLGLT